ncbi:MAG: PAS domain-containing protein [Desulfobacterales bacterium]|nr:MAG: PAS domain-containing protein [Desulfobacterales bacterium]
MRDKDKTKAQLIRELEELRQKVPLKSETGRVEGLMTSSINITKRKEVEEILGKNEQEKIAILDSLMEHVVFQDREMKILWANRAACESVHMKREDLLGRHCHEVWADRQTPCEDCPVTKARDTKQPQAVEKMSPDGRWWYIQGHQVQDDNGHVMGTTELTLDITDRKRAEEALRKAKDELELRVGKRSAELVEANEKLRQEIEERKRAENDFHETKNLLSNSFNALQDLVVVIDKDLRVIMSNWKDHDDISEKDRQAHPYCYEVFMNRKKPCNPCHAMEVFTTGEIKQLEHTNPIDGKINDIRVLPIFDDEGKVVSVIEHIRDITERKQAEIQIRTLSQQLIQSQESERQMISRELHDRVTQDLSSIKIGIDTLVDREPCLSAEVRKNVLEYSQILQKAIGSVRDLSYDLHPPGLDDMGLVHALFMYCDEFAEKSGVKVNFEPVGMSNFFLDSDTELNLYRLVQEGLNNIRKHAHAGQANVKLVGTYPNIILRIEDNGKGFDLQERMRTVDRQRRMGLRSMAERVSLMQGEMTIQSQPMKGTHIFIKFPYQEKKYGSKENHIDR